MTERLRFDLEDALVDVRHDGYQWFWKFQQVSLSSGALWRVLRDGDVVLTSQDHGQQFGLPEPVDAVSMTVDAFTGSKLRIVSIEEKTGDLNLTFDSGTVLQVLVSSSGYESFDLEVGTRRYVGVGGGRVDEMVLGTDGYSYGKPIT
jgi:hypothetical protein